MAMGQVWWWLLEMEFGWRECCMYACRERREGRLSFPTGGQTLPGRLAVACVFAGQESMRWNSPTHAVARRMVWELSGVEVKHEVASFSTCETTL